MDPTINQGYDVKEKLLSPDHVSQASIVEISPGQTRGGFAPAPSTRLHPAAEKHHVHYQHQESGDPDRFGRACRTVVQILLVAVVCTGFGLLFMRMVELERQVEVLTELTATADGFDWAPYDGEPGNIGDVYHEQTEENGDPLQSDDVTFKRDTRSVGDGALHHLARRTVSGTSSRRRVGSSHNQGISHMHVFAHLTPLLRNSEDEHRVFDYSEFLEWNDGEQYAFNQFNLENNKFLVAPFTGYYYIYSQTTLCDVPEGRAKGHSLWVRSNCGQAGWQELAYTLTTQSNGTASSQPRDSSFLGGVFFLRRHDHVGVKPRPLLAGTTGVRLMRTAKTDYFGAILLSRVPSAMVTCSHFSQQH